MMKSIILRIKYSIEQLISNILISLVTNFFKGKSKQALEKLIKNNLINLLSIEKDGMFFVTQNYNKEMDNLIGFSEKSQYEEPIQPDLIINTDLISLENSITLIITKLKESGFLSPKTPQERPRGHNRVQGTTKRPK